MRTTDEEEPKRRIAMRDAILSKDAAATAVHSREQWTWCWEFSNNRNELAPAVLAILILLLSVCYYIWTLLKSRNPITAPLPPGPRGLPVVGYLPFLGTNLHREFTELAQQYGPIYKVWFGQKLCIVLSSPSLAKEVVRDLDTVFANRDPPIAALASTYGGLDIAWAPYGSHWRNMRKLFVRETMSNTRLEDTYSLRSEEVKKTIKDLHSRIGNPIEISQIAFLTEFNVIVSMLWGATVDTQSGDSVGPQFQAVMIKILEVISKPNMSDFFPILARIDLQGLVRETKRLMHRFDQILDPILESGMRMNKGEGDEGDGLKNKGKKDLIQILLELRMREDAEMPITLEQIKTMLLEIVIGATDTTSTIVEWVMAELLHKPELMKKVQQELLDVIGLDKVVLESHVPNLHYLDAVLKETLRLHPVLPLLVPRRPSKSSVVGGYTIPKDTKVLLNVWAMHRDPKAWDDPSEFKPERFFSNSGKWDYSGNNFEYLPFGSGRRICPGIPLAEKMVMHLLASLLHSFNWKLPEGEELDLSEKFGIVMKKSTPLIAIPTQRLSH